jgi:hypothetical protein
MRQGHPRRPNAITRCLSSSLKTLLTPIKGTKPSAGGHNPVPCATSFLILGYPRSPLVGNARRPLLNPGWRALPYAPVYRTSVHHPGPVVSSRRLGCFCIAARLVINRPPQFKNSLELTPRRINSSLAVANKQSSLPCGRTGLMIFGTLWPSLPSRLRPFV